jgi:hypothetical protein
MRERRERRGVLISIKTKMCIYHTHASASAAGAAVASYTG